MRTQHRYRWRGRRFSVKRWAKWGDLIAEAAGFYFDQSRLPVGYPRGAILTMGQLGPARYGGVSFGECAGG